MTYFAAGSTGNEYAQMFGGVVGGPAAGPITTDEPRVITDPRL
jgi:hypothetical protein